MFLYKKSTFYFFQSNRIMPAAQNYSAVLKGKTFSENEAGAELFTVVCNKPSEQNVHIGEYQIKWKR